MQFDLRSRGQKSVLLLVLFSLASVYLALVTAQFLAACFASLPNPVWLKRAIWVDPGNAEIRYRVGELYSLRGSPQDAIPWLRSALESNPHNGWYWIDLAAAQQSVGDVAPEQRSLQQALTVDPNTPEIGWTAANLYLAQGLTSNALQQLHTVLENDPALASRAIRKCWDTRPDIHYLLASVIPPSAYPNMLSFLISRNETAAASKVWDQMVSSQRAIDRQDLFDYVHYLVAHHEPAQAALVWRDAATMASLQVYQPSPMNLLINGDFGLEILNGGFDWIHEKNNGVSLALDPTAPHSSPRSLRITFDGPGVVDAGVSQIVPVQPDTSYEFSAFYKTADMDGAGGMQFAILDAYRGTSFFMSGDLRDADFWKETGGSFTSGPDTHLIVLRIVRMPSGSPIRGKLWIDGLQLVESRMADLSANSAGRISR